MSAGGVVRTAVARRTPGRLPWPPLLCSTAAAGALVGLVTATGGGGALPALQVAGLVLASGAAYLLDDPATAVTQAVPRPLWRRRSATVVRGLAVLTTTWILLLALMTWRYAGLPTGALTLETAVSTFLALTAAALLARAGEPEPGNIVAPMMALLGVGSLLAQPLLGVTLFLSTGGESTGRACLWAGVAISAVLVLVAAWRDPAGRRSPLVGR